MNSRLFYSLFISFFAGVFAFSFLQADIALSGFALLVSIVLFSYLTLAKGRRAALFSLGVTVSFLLGAARVEISGDRDHALDGEVGNKVALVGFVCSEPQAKEFTQRFCFAPEDGSDRVLVTAARYPGYSYGDALKVAGKLAFPKNFESYEGGPEFDYVAYLAKDGIRYTMMRPQTERTGEGRGSIVMSSLIALKGAFVASMQDLMPEPESSLLGGILLGDRQSLPEDVTEEFRSAGLVHILVLSGYNVTIVAESLMKAFAFLPRHAGHGLGALSIVLFALMTGASATTVRASIMALIVILARTVARPYDVARALLIAAFFMVLQNPLILAFDVSFQLSFLATIGLIYVSPLVSERIGFVTDRFKLREILSTTVATQIFVMPYILHAMGELSLVSLATNLLVLPLVPYAMLGGFVAVMTGFASHIVALPFAWATSALLSYMIAVADWFGNLPFASIRIETGALTLVSLYATYAFVLIRLWRRRDCSPRSAN